jgi:hypothetical protein
MYFHSSQLDQRLQDSRLRNFWRTYGFFVVRDFYPQNIFRLCHHEYKRLCAEFFNCDWQTLVDPKVHKGVHFMPNFVDSSEVLLREIVARTNALVSYLLGDDYIYMGSDGSTFTYSSFGWHRDWFTIAPQLKLNSYFNYQDYRGGRFFVIPGSHHPSDFYTHSIGEGLAWPFRSMGTNTLDERDFFPATPSPREYLSLDVSEGEDFEIPSIRLNTAPGDLIVFDQRLVHCVEETVPDRPRMLCTTLYTMNPHRFVQDPFYKEYIYSASQLHRRTLTVEAIDNEIKMLFWAERVALRCSAYGSHITSSPELYPDHLACEPSEIYSSFPLKKEFEYDVSQHVNGLAHPTYKGEIAALRNSDSNLYKPLHYSLNLQNTSPFGRK